MPADPKAALIAQARTQGFDVVGVTSPDAIPEAGERLAQFLADGCHGDMHWLPTRAERRSNPRMLLREVRLIILLGLNYGPAHDRLPLLERRDRCAVSVHTLGGDYHEVITPPLEPPA